MVASTLINKSMTRGEAATLAKNICEASTLINRECTTHQFSACKLHRRGINFDQSRVFCTLLSLYLRFRSTHQNTCFLQTQLRTTSSLCRSASSLRTGYSGKSGGASGINFDQTMHRGVSHLHRRGINFDQSSAAHQKASMPLSPFAR